MDVRETIPLVISRLASERWLLGLLLFHAIGVHCLARARSSWTKAIGGVCLVATVPCWIKAIRVDSTTLGWNASTLGMILGLVLSAGLWLFLCGRGPLEWAIGFGTSLLSVAATFVTIGERWAGAACTFLALPLGVATFWSFRSPVAEGDERRGWLEDVLSLLAVAFVSAVLAFALASGESHASIVSEQTLRLRDFMTQPAILFILGAGGVFSTAAAIRLWPSDPRP
jgi:hypothetical protein